MNCSILNCELLYFLNSGKIGPGCSRRLLMLWFGIVVYLGKDLECIHRVALAVTKTSSLQRAEGSPNYLV